MWLITGFFADMIYRLLCIFHLGVDYRRFLKNQPSPHLGQAMDFALKIRSRRIRLGAERDVILYVLGYADDAARVAAIKNFAEQLPEDHVRAAWRLQIALLKPGLVPGKDYPAELR